MNESLPIGTAAIINTVFKCGTFYDPCLYYRQTQTIGGVVLVSQYKQYAYTTFDLAFLSFLTVITKFSFVFAVYLPDDTFTIRRKELTQTSTHNPA